MYTNPYLAQPVPTYAKGGSVAPRQKRGASSLSLPEMAEKVRAAGREGDTVLAHITPEEAGILKLLGGSGTINPKTGQPEFIKKFVKKIVPKEVYNPISSIGKEIERGVESVAKALGPAGQIAAAYFGGPIGAAIYSGLAPPGSSFDVKRAATAAALTYGTQQLMNAGAPTGGEGAVGGGGFDGGGFDMAGMGTGVDAAAGLPGMGAGISALTPPPAVPSAYDFNYDYSVGAAPSSYEFTASDLAGSTAPAEVSVFSIDPNAPSAPVGPSPDYYLRDTGSGGTGLKATGIEGLRASEGSAGMLGQYSPQASTYGPTGTEIIDRSIISSGASVPTSTTSGLANLAEAIGDTALTQITEKPLQTAMAGYFGTTAYLTKKELDAQREEAERILRDRENKTREQIAFAESVLRDYPLNYQRLSAQDVQKYGMAGGGLAGLTAMAKGGMPPRYLRGGGDGMSDSIPARIAGKQEARLADGEFVIPADVVSHLGNGSSNAGAKKLYAMMDRARQARTGKKRQAPAMKAERVMPV